FGARAGSVAAGFVAAWAAYRTGTVDGFIRRTQDNSVFTMLAVEGLLVGLVGAAIWMGILVAGRAQTSKEAINETTGLSIGGLLKRALTTRSCQAAFVVAIFAGGAAAWAVVQEPLKGQTIFGAGVAGIAAGLAGRLVGVTIGEEPGGVPVILAMAVLSFVGPLTVYLAPGSDDVVGSLYSGDFVGSAAPLSLDWLAGSLLGVPIGLNWVGSMMDKRQPEARASSS
ncbi:MAG: hypothetical protein KDA28_11410, partial [Phycisphaerales bacterium]|nr:hypothetical protein [Phycisphaerales bacterium]